MRPKLPKWLRRVLTVLGLGTAACMKVTTGTPQVVCGAVGAILTATGLASKDKEPFYSGDHCRNCNRKVPEDMRKSSKCPFCDFAGN